MASLRLRWNIFQVIKWHFISNNILFLSRITLNKPSQLVCSGDDVFCICMFCLCVSYQKHRARNADWYMAGFWSQQVPSSKLACSLHSTFRRTWLWQSLLLSHSINYYKILKNITSVLGRSRNVISPNEFTNTYMLVALTFLSIFSESMA